MARRRKGDPVHGWMAIDKPSGVSSAGAVAIAKRATNAAKIGHGGTLDPLATGVLPLAFGEATKTVSYVMDGAKRYRVTVRWGEARNTDDAEGEVIETSGVRPSRAEIEAVLPAFTGVIEQVPPAYSAIKVGGERAYKLARADKDVVLAARPARIDSLALIEMPDDDHAVFEVGSGKGVYMRSLARDIGAALGTCAYVAGLRRTACGPFDETHAIPLEKLESVRHSPAALEHLLPVETVLDDIPALALTDSEVLRIKRGQPVPVLRTADRKLIEPLEDGATLCAMAGGRLVAFTRLDGRQIRPVRVINQ